MEGRTVAFSKTEQVHVVLPPDLNGAGRLFGGKLLQMLDEIAGVVAMRHCQSCHVTTAAIDNLAFKKAIYLNDLVVLVAYPTYTGNTSMEVRIDTYVENPDGMRHLVNRAFFVMVAIDDNGHPVKVPPLIVQTPSEQAEWEAALCRRKNRLERKKAGF